MPEIKSAPVLRFGVFEVNPAARALRKYGIRIRLSGQPFAILEMLLEKPGEVVSREEMRKKLWASDTFVDFEHSLNSAIKKLRSALGDSPENSRYIETIPRLGYRFIAPVNSSIQGVSAETAPHSGVSTAPAESEPKVLQPPGVPGTRGPVPRQRVRWYAAALALLTLSTIGTYFIRKTWRPIAHSQPRKIMLAVLPFDNFTGDPGNEYFSDGLTDEMITQLALLQPDRLGVIARTSVMSYKHSDKSVERVASQLGVQYIVEGSLRQSLGRTRITAQLIQVKDQTHIWAQEYDRDTSDILTLEREVASGIARAIQLELTPGRNAGLAQTRALDPEAHELYLKGRFYWNKRTQEGYKKAIGYFEGAIRKDPDYAEAYAGLADGYHFLMAALPPEEVMPKARAAAERALVLNPDLAEAHASLGLILSHSDWDWEGARRHLQRAIELSPNLAIAHDWYAEGYLSPMGRLDESLAELRVAQRLDPLSPVILTDIGKTLYFARRYDEAIAQLRGTLDLDPTFISAASYLWPAYVEREMYEEALKITENWPGQRDFFGSTYTYARMGRSELARQRLTALLSLSKKEHVDPGAIAAAYVALGEKDQAMTWLEKAYAERSTYVGSLKVLVYFDPIRNDPRFVDLERRAKLLP